MKGKYYLKILVLLIMFMVQISFSYVVLDNLAEDGKGKIVLYYDPETEIFTMRAYPEGSTLHDTNWINMAKSLIGYKTLIIENRIKAPVNSSGLFSSTHMKILGLENLDVSNVRIMSHMFYNSYEMNNWNISNWDVRNVTDMSHMFENVLTNPDVSKWDVSNVINMSHMFSNAIKANPDVSKWNVRNVTDMTSMFKDASQANPDVSKWDVSNVKYMNSMFWNASQANPDVSNWDVGNVISMYGMFLGASQANPDVSKWDVSKVIDMSNMFYNTNLADPDVSKWNVRNVIDMSSMFSRASQANPDVSNWDVSNVKNIQNIFSYKFKTETIKKIDSMENKTKEEKEQLKSYLYTSNVEKFKELISVLKQLNYIELQKNIEDLKLYLQDFISLTDAQKLNLINELNANNLAKIKEKANSLTKMVNDLKLLKFKLVELTDESNLHTKEFNDKIKELKTILETIITKEEAEKTIKDINELLNQSENDKQDKINQDVEKEKQLNKEKTKEYINNLLNLTFKQKEILINELTYDNLENTKGKATILNDKMSELNSLKQKLEELTNESNLHTQNFNLKISKLKLNIKDIETINVVDINNLISEINEIINQSSADKELKKLLDKVDLTKYKKYADIFMYEDNSIISRANEDIYFDVNVNRALENLVEGKFDFKYIMTGAKLGFNLKVRKTLDLRMGAFVEYEYKNSHNIGIGTMLSYKDVKGYVRYRLAKYEDKLNHNIDMYVSYGHRFNLLYDKLEIEPKIGSSITYSSKVRLAEKVQLKDRVGIVVDAGARVEYKVGELGIYVEPKLKGGYNNQEIEEIGREDNKLKIERSYFEYEMTSGIRYRFQNNISVDGNMNLRVNMKKDIRVGANIGIGYSF